MKIFCIVGLLDLILEFGSFFFFFWFCMGFLGVLMWYLCRSSLIQGLNLF